MGSTLTGSAPKATFSTSPTIAPSQNQLLNDLVGILEGGDPVRGVQQYTGQFSAPLNSTQNKSLAGLEQLALPQEQQAPVTKTGEQTAGLSESFRALTAALGYQAPKIDSTEAFSKGVIAPLTDAFNTQILPGISGQYAGSAGGAFSSGRQQASQQAGQTLEQTLAAQGSKFAYDTAAANQNADLQANQQRLGALGLAPAINAAPTAIDTSIATTNAGITSERLRQLLGVLQGGEVARGVDQTQLTGQYGEFQRQQSEEQQIIADFLAAAGMPTVQTSGVGSGGSSGLLGGLLGGLGGSGGTGGGFGGALGSWLFGASMLSDERAKTDIEHVGDVDGFPLYRYKYKGEAQPRLGLIAQDVEKRLPRAVGRVPGTDMRTVDYGAVLEHVLMKEAA